MSAKMNALFERHSLSDDLLRRYALHALSGGVPDYDGFRLQKADIDHIETHLESCAGCRARVAELQAEYEQIDLYLTEAGLPDLRLDRAAGFRPVLAALAGRLRAAAQTASALRPALRPRHRLLGAGIVLLLLIALIAPRAMGPSGASLRALATIEKESLSITTRGSHQTALLRGLQLYERGECAAAIAELDRLTGEMQASPQRAYVYYVLGLATLYAEENRFLARLRRPDLQMLARGSSYLRQALAETNSYAVRENCHWYLAQAALLSADPQAAEQHLQQVVLIRGRKVEKARQLLARLKQRQKSK